VGKTEVTRGQYKQFMKAGGYTKQDLWSPEGLAWKQEVQRVQPDDWDQDVEWANPPGQFKQTDDHPIVGVNYYEAEAFCRWAGLRLLTEAEWEKAARWDGQNTRIYAWGDTWDVTRSNNANDPLYKGGQTAPIGKYPSGASACGSLDMIGNVWEWVLDWHGPEYYLTSPSSNPQGPSTGDLRVIKGGSWFGSNWVGADNNDRLRGAQRGSFDPHNTNGGIGFRCAVTTMPE
jgi:formylglycine-generating enzyme required for sulfatase activity